MDKKIGFKIKFMFDVLEFGWLDSLDIFVDKNCDGKLMLYFNLIVFSC